MLRLALRNHPSTPISIHVHIPYRHVIVQKVGKSLHDEFPQVPVMALTATATPAVRADVRRSLYMGAGGRGYAELVSSFVRPNLR